MMRELNENFYDSIFEYFPSRTIYEYGRSKQYMLSILTSELSLEEQTYIQDYASFKGRHEQSEEQKEIAKRVKNINNKLDRWYKKIGDELYGVTDSSGKMEDNCAICLKKHCRSSTRTLRCGHEFGWACFDKWCKGETRVPCPLCRRIC